MKRILKVKKKTRGFRIEWSNVMKIEGKTSGWSSQANLTGSARRRTGGRLTAFGSVAGSGARS